jgi:hypothetical protein
MSNKFNTGDFVKWKEISKGGREYYERGMITDYDDRFAKIAMLGNSSNYISYTILTDDGEEVRKNQHELEIDIQAERDSTLNNLFDDE